MVNIFIANLDWTITSEDLKTTFETFGEVSYAHVVFEKETKRSRGFGYIEMESSDAAIAAIEALNGVEINGRAIDVKIATAKPNRVKKEDKKPEKKFFKKGGNFSKNKPYNSDSFDSNKKRRRRTSETNDGEKTYQRVERPKSND